MNKPYKGTRQAVKGSPRKPKCGRLADSGSRSRNGALTITAGSKGITYTGKMHGDSKPVSGATKQTVKQTTNDVHSRMRHMIGVVSGDK